MTNRCGWAGEDPLMIEYHDCEWGVPLHDDRTLFEFLVLEGAQLDDNSQEARGLPQRFRWL